MAVRITSLVNYLLNVPGPIEALFEARETRDYPFIEWDSVVNDKRIDNLIKTGKIVVKDLEELTTEYVSEWDKDPKLELGGYTYWVDTTGALRQKLGNPTHDLDGVVIGPGAATKNVLNIDGLITAAMVQYQAGYISANNTIAPTDCSSATGTFQSATFAGVYNNVSGEIVNRGKVEVRFDTGLTTPVPAAGQPAILSWLTNGQFRNKPPALKSGDYLTHAGTILDASNYLVNQRCLIILNPDTPIQRK